MTSDRVAVVVVHGIADQRPGQTVREVARLLCHGADRAPRYVQGEIHDVLVPVEKLEPGAGLQQDAALSARRQPGTLESALAVRLRNVSAAAQAGDVAGPLPGRPDAWRAATLNYAVQVYVPAVLVFAAAAVAQAKSEIAIAWPGVVVNMPMLTSGRTPVES
jgi:hypothetical protein